MTEGVFAAIALNGGATIGNSGIIDLGGRTLIYDTFMTPQAAQDLRNVTQEVTGRDPDFIINSHYHNDHIWGNQAFSPQAHIISTTQTCDLFLTMAKPNLRMHSATPLLDWRSSANNIIMQKVVVSVRNCLSGWDITREKAERTFCKNQSYSAS